MDTGSTTTVGRTYTTGRRQPYLIRKWPGSNWTLPMGPYTITQMVVFVLSVYLLLTYRDVWAHFGPFNLVIGVGLPVALTYATRHTRIEGRDPVRAGIAVASLMVRPPRGYLNGAPVRDGKTWRTSAGQFPVARLPASLLPPPAWPAPPPAAPPRPRWVADLVSDAARTVAGGAR